MPTPLISTIKSLLGDDRVKSEHKTTKGFLYIPNGNLRLGPKYLIRVNFPLEKEEIDWGTLNAYFGGGNEDVCRDFFLACNGFAFARCFSAPGILTHDPYDGQGFSKLNVPFDLRSAAHGSYPQFGPDRGYFISVIRLAGGQQELCDVVLPDGSIVFGEFRKSIEVLGEFPDLQSWISDRVPRALNEMGLT